MPALKILVGIAGMTAAYKQASKNYQDNYKHVETIRQVFLNSLTVPYRINSVGTQSTSTLSTLVFLARKMGLS